MSISKFILSVHSDKNCQENHKYQYAPSEAHQWICGYPNQQYHLVSSINMYLYVVTRTVNLQDATRKRVQ